MPRVLLGLMGAAGDHDDEPAHDTGALLRDSRRAGGAVGSGARAALDAALRHLATREIGVARLGSHGCGGAGGRELAVYLAERLASDRDSTLARYELFAEAARGADAGRARARHPA